MNSNKIIAVVGGGIAGVSCVESLIQDYDPSESRYGKIVLVSESKIVKKVVNFETSGRNLERFDVTEDDVHNFLGSKLPEGLEFESIVGRVDKIFYNEKTLSVKGSHSSTREVAFDIVCICCGSKPKQLCVAGRNHQVDERIVVLRDTNTVENLRRKLLECKHIVIVGNGGISLELVSKISYCKKTWIIRDESIGLTFFDSGASKFLLDSTHSESTTTERQLSVGWDSAVTTGDRAEFGPALGPNWLRDLQLKGKFYSLSRELEIIYNDEVRDVTYNSNKEFTLTLVTKGGKQIDCDLIASAIGVVPNSLKVIDGELKLSDSDGGILIDEQMRTSLPGIYASGDIVSCENWPSSELWFQMRLWTQARQMGFYAGKCISSHLRLQDPTLYFNFDCFTHCTTFFGYKLVLLGRYNGQFIDDKEAEQCEVIARVNKNKDYVKIIIKSGKIIGAVLVGDSGLEETIENLIHDKIDVSLYKDHLLDGTVDIEDYFD